MEKTERNLCDLGCRLLTAEIERTSPAPTSAAGADGWFAFRIGGVRFGSLTLVSAGIVSACLAGGVDGWESIKEFLSRYRLADVAHAHDA
jgi:hypothetical protein